MWFFALLPLPVSHAIGWLTGHLVAVLPGQIRDVSRRNIDLCFSDLPDRQRRQLVTGSLVETGKTAVELGALWLRSARRTLQLVRRVDGLEHVEHGLAQGRGIILVTPHLGAWEIAGLYCASRFDITCLYRPLRMPQLETLVNDARSRAGGHYVPTTAKGIRELYRALDDNRAVAMLPDQEPQAGTGLFAPFFGVQAYTMVFLSRLAARNRTPIIFVWAERLSFGRGYHLHFTPANENADSDDLEQSVAAINLTVERMVREQPAQYQWSYKRFRTRPEGEQSVY